MAEYELTLTVEGTRQQSVEKRLREMFGEEIEIDSVEKIVSAGRDERFSEAEADFGNSRDVVSALKDELQAWLDSMPENLQFGTKAEEIREVINELETLEGSMESIQFPVIDFPGFC